MVDSPKYEKLVTKVQALEQEVARLQHVEKELTESREHFKLLYDRAPLAYQSLDEHGNILDVNPSWLNALGYTREDVIGRSFADFLDPDWQEHFRERFPHFKAVGEILGIEFHMLKNDGSPILVSFYGKIGRDSSGTFQRTHCMFQDVTKLHKTTQDLVHSNQRYQWLFDDSPIPLWEEDLTELYLYLETIKAKVGKNLTEFFANNPDEIKTCADKITIIDVNKAAIALHGAATKEELFGHINIIFNENSMETFAEECIALASGATELEIEGEVCTITGDPRQVFVKLLVSKDVLGRQKALVATMDLTERKYFEERLRQIQKMESIGRLAGGIAHDFNNMLSIILGHTELVVDELGDNHSSIANLNEIARAAQRSAKLTKQLLGFARKQTTSPQVLDLNTTLEDMLKMIGRLIGENIDLAWIPSYNLWPVKIDPAQVDQILTNLCINARDAISGNGKVTIETNNVTLDDTYCRSHAGCTPGDYVMIAVTDNGCGMTSETINKVFEPFFTTKGIGQGTGLGLATTYGIVKQNKGFIYIYSEPDQGTGVKLYLPRIPQQELEQTSTTHHQSTEKSQAVILLVEDNASILDMVTLMLKGLGYTVLAAQKPAEAISIAATTSSAIDLLFTDVVMPEMSGHNLARELVNTRPKIKCLFMSGYTKNVMAHHGVLDNEIEFIQKPFVLQDLATKIEEILQSNP